MWTSRAAVSSRLACDEPANTIGESPRYGARRFKQREPFVALPLARRPAASIGDDADGRADDAREIRASLEMRVRAVDGPCLQNVQSLASGDTGCVIDEDDSADALVSCERMSGRATQFSGSDDANSRHESVEYSSCHNSQLHNSQIPTGF